MKKRKLYHKCSIVGLINLIEEFDPGCRICTSSLENSSKLFWRDVCIVLDVPQDNVVAENDFDIDSKGQSEYDEIRVKFATTKKLLDAISYIILDGKKLRTIKSGKHNSPDAVNGKLTHRFFNGRNHQEAESLAIKDFFEQINFGEVLNLTQAKKINKDWHGSFLNM